MKYEDAIKIWAARKAEVDVDKIKSVDIDIETWTEGNSYGDEWSTPYVEVSIRWKKGGSDRTIEMDRYSFNEILEEVIAVSQEAET